MSICCIRVSRSYLLSAAFELNIKKDYIPKLSFSQEVLNNKTIEIESRINHRES